MRKVPLPIAVAALTVGLCSMPVAHADEQSYLNNLANYGFTGPSSVALQIGYTVCTDRQNGVQKSTTVQWIENTGGGVSPGAADYIYGAAVSNLC